MEEKLIRRLVSTIKCSVCGSHYKEGSVRVMGNQEGLWFLSAVCRQCSSRCLVAIVAKDEAISEVVCDLTEEEIQRFEETALVGPDDVLDMRNFFKDFDGDFSRFFSREKESSAEEL